MKRLASVMLPAIIAIAVFGCSAYAQTANDWSVKLSFSTSNTSDLLPITIGEGQSATEIMKPPPMPGKAITGDEGDAIVNAYIKSSTKRVANSIAQTDTTLPGRVWTIDVYVEKGSAPVSLSADLSKMYSGYTLSVVDPDTGTKTKITQSNTPVEIFTSAASGGTKTLFVLAGSSSSYAVSEGTNVKGGAATAYLADTVSKAGIKVYVDGAEKATTDETGAFSITGLSTGSHAIKIDGPNLLAAIGTITIASDGTAAIAIADPKPADANDDGKINLSDFTYLKACFGKTAVDPSGPCTQERFDAADFNKDGVRNLSDFTLLKKSFGLSEQ